MNKIRIRRPDDFHVHLRGGRMLEMVAGYTSGVFGRALVMPNVPAIVNANEMVEYRRQIEMVTDSSFKPLMTIKLMPDTTPEVITMARNHGCVAVKIYPSGVTTGSHDGPTVDDLHKMGSVFEEMQKLGMVLCWHCEHPSKEVFCLDAELAMLPEVDKVISGFPKLKQVIEHITTDGAVDWVMRASDNVAATITVHHLFLSLNDVFGRGQWCDGGKMNPHHFCWPVAKHFEDRRALCRAAISGNPKFFLGTDTAPHLISDKLGSDDAVSPGRCCAGLFTAPVAMQALTWHFDMSDSLGLLESFVSEFGARFYHLNLNDSYIEMQQCDWLVPDTVCDGEIVPFLAGEIIPWKLA